MSSKLSKKELYKPPSYGELKSLEFAEKQLNSHLLSLQISELLQEVASTHETRCKVDAFLLKLIHFVTSLPPCGSDISIADILAQPEEENGVKIAFPRHLLSSIQMKGSYCFKPPSKSYSCGSWKYDCAIDKVVDIALVMSNDSFHEKDYLNYRCFVKRALFMRHIATRLLELTEDSPLGKLFEISYNYVGGNCLWPCVTLKTNDIKRFTFRLIPFFDRPTFKLSRFGNETSNIRIDENLVISHSYNQSALADLTSLDTQNRLDYLFTPKDEAATNTNLLNGLRLLKIWSKQRVDILSSGMLINGYFWTLFICFLLNTKRLNLLMTPLQVFKITLQSFCDETLLGNGVHNISGNTIKVLPEMPPSNWQSFDVVLTDASGFCNYTAQMTMNQLEKMRVLGRETIHSLENFDRFDAVFLEPIKSSDFYDQTWSFPLSFSTLQLQICESVAPQILDAVSNVKSTILQILNRGLKRRVECMDFIDHNKTVKSHSVTFFPTVDGLILNEREHFDLKIGVCFKGESFLDVIDKGPVAESPEASKFRAFWRSKAELRRFADGSILEAVVWNDDKLKIPAAERSVSSRRSIPFEMFAWILENHFQITNDVKCSNEHSEKLLTPLLRKFNRYGTGEDIFLAMNNSYEKLTKMLRSVERMMALGFHSIQPLSESFRYTSVFPPLPATFDMSMAEQSGQNRLPSTKKLCPPFIGVNEIIVMLDGSGTAWPEDWNAFRRLRAALHLQLYQTFNKEWPDVAKQSGVNHIDVCIDGFVFRLKLRCLHEINILRTVRNTQSGKVSTVENEKADRLVMETQTKPKLTQLLRNLAVTQHFAYASTCRLVKRWLASHMFCGHFTDDVIDIMVAYLFISPGAVPAPLTPVAGFCRFLKLLATHDWRMLPLVVNLNAEFTPEKINEILLDFAKKRQNYPAFSIISPVDAESKWTQQTPSVVVFNRMLILAAKTFEILSSPLENYNFEDLFQPDLNVFDVVIELDQKFLSRRHEAVNSHASGNVGAIYVPKFNEAKQGSSKSLAGVVLTQSKKFPVVDFDMQEKLVHELNHGYGEIALFFYDKYGGSKIGVVWKPTVEKEFKLQNMNLSMPQIEEKSVTKKASSSSSLSNSSAVCLVTNKAAAIADFNFIGQGIITDVRQK